MEATVHHKPVNTIQKFRDFLNLIDDYQRPCRLVYERLPEGIRVALERLPHRINQKIVIDCIREPLLQECRFTYLACSKKEHPFIQLILYIEDSFVHGSLEFKVIKSDFPMKFGNPGTNLIKFILVPKSL